MQDALAVVGDLTRPKTYSICTVHQEMPCYVATAMPRLITISRQGSMQDSRDAT